MAPNALKSLVETAACRAILFASAERLAEILISGGFRSS